MDLNKDNVLKSIKSFIGADNELAIKEAEHQIKIFDVVFQKELLEYSEKDETKKDESLSPDKLEENILILEAIDNYKKEKTKIKEKKAKKEKLNIQSKDITASAMGASPPRRGSRARHGPPRAV